MTRSFKRAQASTTTAALVAGLLIAAPAAALGSGAKTTYVVLAESGAATADVVRAISSAGGTVTSRNDAIGTFSVLAPADGFVEAVSASKAVFGATGERPIGRLPDARPVKGADPEVESIHAGGPEAPSRRIDRRHGSAGFPGLGPRDGQVRSGPAVNAGDNRVLVGILDSGIDASHPDLAGQLGPRCRETS